MSALKSYIQNQFLKVDEAALRECPCNFSHYNYQAQLSSKSGEINEMDPSNSLQINLDLCQSCSRCKASRACKLNAIVQIDPGEQPYLDTDRCRDCRVCIPFCPYGVLQKQIADLRKRMPKHSISIAMLMELDDLEEELEKALSKSGRGLFLP